MFEKKPKKPRVLYRLVGAEREEVARLVRAQVMVKAQLEALLKMIAVRERATDKDGNFATDLDALAFVAAPPIKGGRMTWPDPAAG